MPLAGDPEAVLRWASNAALAAAAANVELLVSNSSTPIPAELTRMPSVELRREVESLLRQSGVPAIALRPPLFMENRQNPGLWSGIPRSRHRSSDARTPAHLLAGCRRSRR